MIFSFVLFSYDNKVIFHSKVAVPPLLHMTGEFFSNPVPASLLELPGSVKSAYILQNQHHSPVSDRPQLVQIANHIWSLRRGGRLSAPITRRHAVIGRASRVSEI